MEGRGGRFNISIPNYFFLANSWSVWRLETLWMHLLVLRTPIFPAGCRTAPAFEDCNEVIPSASDAGSKRVYCGNQEPSQKAPISELRGKRGHSLKGCSLTHLEPRRRTLDSPSEVRLLGVSSACQPVKTSLLRWCEFCGAVKPVMKQ